MASFKEIRRTYNIDNRELVRSHRRDKAQLKIQLDEEWVQFMNQRRLKKQEFQRRQVLERMELYRQRLRDEEKLRQLRAAVREARQREAAAKRQIEAQVEALKAAAAAAGLKLTINLSLLAPVGEAGAAAERPKMPLTNWQKQLQRVGRLIAANNINMAKPGDRHQFTGISKFCSFLRTMGHYARHYVPGIANLDSDESIVKLAKAFRTIPACLSTQQQSEWCHEITSAPVADGVIVVPPA